MQYSMYSTVMPLAEEADARVIHLERNASGVRIGSRLEARVQMVRLVVRARTPELHPQGLAQRSSLNVPVFHELAKTPRRQSQVEKV